jgi:glyoxylase I family protein
MIRGCHHIGINTSDLDRLADFYARAFGFRPAMDQAISWRDNAIIDRTTGVHGSVARMLMMEAGNLYLELLEYSAPSPRSAAPLAPNDRGYTHLAIDVIGIEEEMERLAALGMVFLSQEPMTFGRLRAVYGRDPDGNLIELIELDDSVGYGLGRLAGFRMPE